MDSPDRRRHKALPAPPPPREPLLPVALPVPRVLEQLLYKWPHARRDIGNALADQYAGVVENGRPVTTAEITRDVRRLFSENFLNWTGRSPAIAAAPAV